MAIPFRRGSKKSICNCSCALSPRLIEAVLMALIAPPAGITLHWLPEPEKALRDSFENHTCLFRPLYTPYKNILNKNMHRYVAQSGNLFYNDLYTHTMQAIRTAG